MVDARRSQNLQHWKSRCTAGNIFKYSTNFAEPAADFEKDWAVKYGSTWFLFFEVSGRPGVKSGRLARSMLASSFKIFLDTCTVHCQEVTSFTVKGTIRSTRPIGSRISILLVAQTLQSPVVSKRAGFWTFGLMGNQGRHLASEDGFQAISEVLQAKLLRIDIPNRTISYLIIPSFGDMVPAGIKHVKRHLSKCTYFAWNRAHKTSAVLYVEGKKLADDWMFVLKVTALPLHLCNAGVEGLQSWQNLCCTKSIVV